MAGSLNSGRNLWNLVSWLISFVLVWYWSPTTVDALNTTYISDSTLFYVYCQTGLKDTTFYSRWFRIEGQDCNTFFLYHSDNQCPRQILGWGGAVVQGSTKYPRIGISYGAPTAGWQCGAGIPTRRASTSSLFGWPLCRKRIVTKIIWIFPQQQCQPRLVFFSFCFGGKLSVFGRNWGRFRFCWNLVLVGWPHCYWLNKLLFEY